MDQKMFEDCLSYYMNSDGHTKFWPDLALKYNFKDGEELRDKFKKERKKRGIPARGQIKEENISKNNFDRPRVAVCDIETLPIISYNWGIWDQNIGLDQIISDGCMLGWAGKFLNEPEIYSDILTNREAKNRDTLRITKSIWEFLSKADVVIGHNYSQYDVKYINTEFLRHELPPLKYTIVDTLVVAKQNFRFSSNKMKFLNDQLGIRNKIDNNGFNLWKLCDQGNEEALKEMLEYNIGDIGATEELFYKVRPYVRNFNVALYNTLETEQCPVCGSTNLKEEGFYYTNAGKWESIRCQDCKCVSRRKTNLLSKEKKKSLLINS